MKKLLIGILCAGMVLSTAACGGNSSSDSASGTTAAAQTEAAKLDPKEVYAEAMEKNAVVYFFFLSFLLILYI